MSLNIFKTQKQVEALTAEVKELKADNDRLVKAAEDFKQKEAVFSLGSQDYLAEKEKMVAEHKAEIAKFNEEMEQRRKEYEATLAETNSKYAQDMEALKKEYAAQLEAKDAEIVAAKNSANKVAAEKLAAIGIPEETIKPTATSKSDGEILKAFENLNGPEKAKFYNENKEAILRATGLTVNKG